MRKNYFYTQSYYNKIYNKEYADKQQQWFDDYMTGKYSPFIGRIKPVLESIKKYVRGKTVLDLGCGVGTFAIILGKIGYQVCGVDLSDEAIKKCERNKRIYHAKNVIFFKEDVSKKVFKEKKFDAIIAADIIEHLPEDKLNIVLNNCYSWLKRGGILIIHTFPSKYYYQTLGKTAILLQPLLLIPEIFDNFYVWLLEKFFFNPWWILRRGISHKREVAESCHCNPPHPYKFAKKLEKIGFKILEKKLLSVPLSDLATDKPKCEIIKKLILEKDIIKPDIYLVAEK